MIKSKKRDQRSSNLENASPHLSPSDASTLSVEKENERAKKAKVKGFFYVHLRNTGTGVLGGKEFHAKLEPASTRVFRVLPQTRRSSSQGDPRRIYPLTSPPARAFKRFTS